MKFLIFALIATVALAAENKEGCKTEGDFYTNCPACKELKFDSGDCKAKIDEGDLQCTFLKKCIDDVEEAEKKEKQDAADAAAKTHCPEDKKDCSDKDSFCKTWADDTNKASECLENPDWMFRNCQNSCCTICNGKNRLGSDQCPKTEDDKELCADNQSSSCGKWAENGECDKNPKWMVKNCMRSCCDTCKTLDNGCPATKTFKDGTNLCKNTHDDDKECTDWAKKGECTKNPKWMMANCQVDCCPSCAAKPPARTTTTPGRTTTTNRVVYQQPRATTNRVVYQQPTAVYQQPVIQQRVAQPVIQQRVAQPSTLGTTTLGTTRSTLGTSTAFGSYNTPYTLGR
jgi:hypothetical protein